MIRKKHTQERADQKIGWRKIENNLSGYIDFTKLFHESETGVAYAYSRLEVSRDTDIKFGIGSNDGVRFWLNGKLLLDQKVSRKAEPNQDILTASLKKRIK